MERRGERWVGEHSLGDLAHFIIRSLVQLHEIYTRGHGISAGHAIFLHQLWRREGITQHELSRLLAVGGAASAAALRRIEDMFLVKRQVNPRDQRERLVFLTNRAHGLLETILIPAEASIQSLAIRGFSDEEVALLRSLLLRAIDNLSQENAKVGGASRRRAIDSLERSLACDQ